MDKLLIRLRPDLPPTVLLDTLWHELEHALEYLWSLSGLSDEETRVSVGATARMLLLLENPRLLQWLTSSCQRILGDHGHINFRSGNTWRGPEDVTREQLLLGIDGLARI